MDTAEQWTNLPPMRVERQGCAAAVVGGKLYAIGGKDERHNNLSSGEVYDPKTKSWNSILPMWTKRKGCAAAEVGGKLYVIGGNDAQTVHSSGEVFDPDIQCWMDIPPMDTERTSCAAVEVGGKMYVFGGYDNGYTDLSSVEVFDPSTQCWSSVNHMKTGRSGCAAVKMGGRIYVVGGSHMGVPLSSVEVFDPITELWAPFRPMGTTRSGCAAVGMGGKLYAIGGLIDNESKNKLTSSAEEFDQRTQRWTPISSMSTDRHECSAVGIEGQLYVVGGMNNSRIRLSSMESIQVHRSGPTYPKAVKRLQPHQSSSLTAAPVAAYTQTSNSVPVAGKIAGSRFSPRKSKQQQQPPPTATASSATIPQTSQSQLPQTMQLLQSKIPTGSFIPVAAEVVQVEEAHVSESPASIYVPQNLKNATTEQVCQWLSKHGVSKASLDVLRREEIDGTFLFEESIDDVRSMLKDEGIKLGQVSKIRSAIEEAKRSGSLV